MFRLHPVLKFIYLLLRIISWAGLHVFYRRRVILGREHLNIQGAAIVVVNHPSTLMDVLNPCIHIPRESFFLANYSLFKHPVSNWLLTRLYSIPVKRREDVAEGESRNNEAAFEKSIVHLEKQGMLFIAAEGVSWMDRTVRPFKTGAARISFGAEKRHDWQLDTQILPIGLSYSAPNLFRSEVIVHFGKPINVGPWMAAEQSNPEQAIEDFTQHLREKVSELTLETHTQEKQAPIEQLEILAQPLLPKGGVEYFNFRKKLIENNLHRDELLSAINEYFVQLNRANLTDHGVYQAAFRENLFGLQGLLLILGAPLALAGLLFWWLPCYLPWLIAKKMNLYIGYDSNVKFLVGLFSFPLALWGAFELMQHYSGNNTSAWLLLPALIFLAYFVEFYLDVWRYFKANWDVRVFKQATPAAFEKLVGERNTLMQQVQLPS